MDSLNMNVRPRLTRHAKAQNKTFALDIRLTKAKCWQGLIIQNNKLRGANGKGKK